MSDFIAKIVSLVSSPSLIIIPLTYGVIFKSTSNITYSLRWTFISMFFVFLAGLFILYGVVKGYYSNFDISKREQRGSIFAFAIALTIIYMMVIVIFKGPNSILLSLLGFLLGIAVISAVNTKVKASIHLAVFSSVSVALGILYGGVFWALLILAPLVAWSRIRLKKHILSETIIGAVLGTLLVLFLYYVVTYTYGAR